METLMPRVGDWFDERLEALEALAHKLISHEDPEVKAVGEDVSKTVTELRGDAPAVESEIETDAATVERDAETAAETIATDAEHEAAPVAAETVKAAETVASEAVADVAKDA
jgi:hypothetical protein